MKLKILLLIPILSSSIFAFNTSKYINQDHCDQLIINPYFKVCYDYNLIGAKVISYTLDGEKVNKINIKKSLLIENIAYLLNHILKQVMIEDTWQMMPLSIGAWIV